MNYHLWLRVGRNHVRGEKCATTTCVSVTTTGFSVTPTSGKSTDNDEVPRIAELTLCHSSRCLFFPGPVSLDCTSGKYAFLWKHTRDLFLDPLASDICLGVSGRYSRRAGSASKRRTAQRGPLQPYGSSLGLRVLCSLILELSSCKTSKMRSRIRPPYDSSF